MSLTYARSDFIDHCRVLENFPPAEFIAAPLDTAARQHVHFPPEERREFFREIGEKLPSRQPVRGERHHHVHVAAIRIEVTPEHRAEELHLYDAPPSAQ